MTKHGLFTLIIIAILLPASIGCGKDESKQGADLPKEIIGKDGAKMVLVPAGEFTMGSPKNEGYGNERPQHKVSLDAFHIDKYEVTNAQYKEFMDATGHEAPGYWADEKYNQPNQPVVGVTWYDAVAYARWVSKRLPTEAEWEKAARGTDGRRYPWGSNWNSLKCNFKSAADGYEYTAPVGSFPTGASPYGAMDMAGNVWEWCADWYDEDHYSEDPEKNPLGPDSGIRRVLRGGCWMDPPRWSLRCAHRDADYPDSRSSVRGFRCARDAKAHLLSDTVAPSP